MGQVTLQINQRTYTVGCGEGEEARIQDLGQYLDQRVQELARDLGQVGEARLLLLAALMVTDDLAASREEITRLKSELTQASENLRRSEGGQGLDRLAQRLESIAAKLENA